MLIGHRDTRHALAAAFAEDRMAHALLFVGPPGIGKARVARELARRVVCREDDPPCGACDRCLRVDAGSHPDVRFVATPHGKKEIGVDVARELKHFVQMTSIDSPSKMVVVEEADRLSIAAQNALLKTLEEPPGSSILILVSESPGALLPTVRSRCQRIRFGPLEDDDVEAVLRQHGLEGEAARPLIRVARGSPGRALEIREMIEGGEIQRLERAVAGLTGDRYVPIVEFADALGRTEQEMTSRIEILEEILQQRLYRGVLDGATDRAATERQLRVLQILARGRRLLRRTNPNRPLLAEATAIELSRL